MTYSRKWRPLGWHQLDINTTLLCEGNPPVASAFPSQRISNMCLWWLLCCWPEHAVKWTAEFGCSRFAPSHREMALLCNDVSHWLSASLESALMMVRIHHFSFGIVLPISIPVSSRQNHSCVTAALWKRIISPQFCILLLIYNTSLCCSGSELSRSYVAMASLPLVRALEGCPGGVPRRTHFRLPGSYINPLSAELILSNMKMYLYFLSFLNARMVQVIEIFPHGRQGFICPTWPMPGLPTIWASAALMYMWHNLDVFLHSILAHN